MKILAVLIFAAGAILGLSYFCAFKAFCQPRPDGTYGELYGPMLYFKPYATWISLSLVVVAALLWIKTKYLKG